MRNKYLVSYNVIYRVPSVDDVLELREELSNLSNGKLESFSYTEKYIKEKGQVVEEYQLVKAKIVVNNEKEPESKADITLGINIATTNLVNEGAF